MQRILALCVFIFSWLLISWPLLASVVTGPIPAAELFREPAYDAPSFSPDGSTILSYKFDGTRKSIELYDVQKGKSFKVGQFSPTDGVGQYYWLSTTQVYVTFNRGGIRKSGVITLTRDEAGAWQGKYQEVTLPVQVIAVLMEEQKVLVSYNLGRSEPQLQLYKMTVSELLGSQSNQIKFAERVTGTPDGASYYDYDPSSGNLIAGIYDKDEKSITFEYRKLAKNGWKLLFEHKNSDYTFKPLAFISDDRLAVLSDKDTDKVALYEFDIKTQQLTKVLYEHEKYDLVSVRMAAKGGLPEAVSYFHHGRFTTEYLNGQNQSLYANLAASLPQQQFLLVDGHRQDMLIVKAFSGAEAGSYYLIAPTANKPVFLGKSLPGLDRYQLAQTVQLEVPTGSSSLEAFLTEAPAAISNGILLVMPHGGPVGGADTDSFTPEIQYLASRGFSVLRVNFRGSAGLGKKFRQQGVGQFGKLIEQDISAAVTQVLKTYSYDRLCSIGSSYGAYSAMMLAIKHPQLYRCVVAGFGIYDLPLLFNASNLKVTEEYRKRVEKVVGTLSDEMYENSPVYHSIQIKAPVLLIAGYNDTIAEFEHSNRMHYVLKRQGAQVDTLFYQNTGHGHYYWAADRHQASYTDLFLRKQLGLPAAETMAKDVEQRKGLAEDYALLADSFVMDDTVANDPEKAHSLYRKAADLGLPDAMYQLGRLYLEGKGTLRDEKAAFLWLEKASTLGSVKANLFMMEKALEQAPALSAYEKAFPYAKRAWETDPSPESTLTMALFYCSGRGTTLNLTQCFYHLDLQQLKQDKAFKPEYKLTQVHYDRRADLFAELLLDSRHTQEQLKQYSDWVVQQLQVSTSDLKLSDVETGTFVKFMKSTKVEPLTGVLDPVSTPRFGARFMLNADNQAKDVAIVVRWTRRIKQGEPEVVATRLLAGDLSTDWAVTFSTEEKKWQQTAIWQLQVFDLKRRELFRQNYELVESKSDPLAGS